MVAVQEQFRSNEAYRELAAGMREVRLPILEGPADGLRQILAHRLRRAELDATVEEIFSDEALREFGPMYVDEGANLRRTLSAIAISVEHTADMGEEMVGAAEARVGIGSGA